MSAGTSKGGHVQLEILARGGDFVVPHALAVHDGGALLVRRAPADDGLRADQRRPVGDRTRLGERFRDGVPVVPVHMRQHVPAVGLEALGGVVVEPADHLAVDRNAVVVVYRDQLAELLHARERGRFVGNALHHAAIAHEHIGMMIDDLVTGPIEGRREGSLRDRHAHRVREALAEGSGGGLDAPRCASRSGWPGVFEPN